MSAVIRRILSNLYTDGEAERTVIIFGQPGSGKTTLLYLLQLGEIVPTIPSFGFNIEKIEAPTSSGQPLKLIGWDIGFGCQSIDRAINIVLPYWATSDALIWIIDASETDSVWFSESATVLARALDAIDCERRLKGAKKDFPILVLANKQDCAQVLPFHRIQDRFGAILSGRPSCIFATSLTSKMDKSGLPEAFEWLRFALDNASAGRITTAAKSSPRPLPNPREANLLKEKIESWISRSETDDDPQTTIEQFHCLSLPSWDHYTHIRVTFLLLTTYGRQKGDGFCKDMVFKGIEKYINESSQARARTFHLTMTYFWIQIVHLGIRNILPSTDYTTTETTLSSSISGMTSLDQFTMFLALNPYVADGNLWADSYSKEVMMSPAAKGGMVLPDKKPLPNLVVRDAITRE
ncbi:hypothetical protein C0992_001636 [Termitomyces sp. T32_za158]|nr:hypothetical protein C0992_001636 [Termitomyces sp. T32_za158]